MKFYLDIIVNSAIHLENVIEDALDMSRIENERFEINIATFDIKEAIQETFDIMQF